MKELSTEQKVRRYDEAIERAKNTIEVNQAIPDIVECVESIFPELKESGDKRIRKALIHFLSEQDGFLTVINDVSVKDIIAWLEKQGEQKPAWSEEDGKMLDSIIEEVRYIGDFPDYPTKEEDELYDECLAKVKWLKSLKDRVQPQQEKERLLGKLEEWLDEYVSDLVDVDTATLICSFTNYLDGKLPKPIRLQPKQEWSEEDKLGLTNTIALIQGYKDSSYNDEYCVESCDYCLNWLKSLRPQNTWKPSDEQMKALGVATNISNVPEKEYQELEKLYQDLKKL